MPISASSKSFLTKPSFEFYRDNVSKNGLLVHWNFGNLNCFDYTDPLETNVINLVANGTGNGGNSQLASKWVSGTIQNYPIFGSVSSESFIVSNNKITIEWVGRIILPNPATNAFVNPPGNYYLTISPKSANFNLYEKFKFVVDGTELIGDKQIVEDRTYYITATYDGSTMTLYEYDGLTGLSVSTKSLTTTLTSSTTGFNVNSTSGYATRSIKFYNRILSETEIFYNRKYF